MATIIQVGPSRTLKGLADGWAAIPNDVVATGGDVYLQFDAGSEFLSDSAFTLNGKTTGPSNRIIIQAAPGGSYRDNANVLNNKLGYDASKGVALKNTSAYTDGGIRVSNNYVEIHGLQIMQFSNASHALVVDPSLQGVIVEGCIFAHFGGSTAIRTQSGSFYNDSIILYGSGNHGVDVSFGSGILFENCTLARIRDNPSYGAGWFASGSGNATVKNCVAFGFDTIAYQMAASECISNATDNATIVGTGLANVPASAVNSLMANGFDLRTPQGSVLIDAGSTPSTYNVTSVTGARQQGTAADIGSWEYPSPVQAPSATVTSVTKVGQQVTITGTSTGSPTGGSFSITKSARDDNFAVSQTTTTATFGTNTFSVVFNNVAAGMYDISFSVYNASFTSQGTNPTGAFTVTGVPITSITQDPIDGQVLTVHGTYTGTPTSATLLVPADSTNPAGAVDVLSNITFSNGNFTVSVTLQPGNYQKGKPVFKSAFGTDLPAGGTSPVTVLAISGNPAAPGSGSTPTPDTTAPVMQGSLSITTVTSTGYTVSWQAATDNVGIANYEFSTNGGTSYVQLGNVLTYAVTGATPNTQYNLAVRAVDTSANKSTPLTASVTTSTAPDSTSPVMVGSISVSNVTQTTATITWQTATDNIGITGYERSLDGGNTYTDIGNVLTSNLTGLTAGTGYSIKIRAYDAAGNRATPLSATLTTTASPDTIAPVMSGTVATSSVTQTTATISWSAGADNVAVTGYEYSTDGGTNYTDAGSVLTKSLTGLTASTTYQLRVRAYDAAGNRSNTVSGQMVTLSAGDTTAPVMVGTISVGAISQTTLALSWQAATDNVAVTGYEYSVDGGTTYTTIGNALNVTAINLTPDTSYNIKVRAYDAEGNRAIPLSVTARTSATASNFTPSVARTVAVQPSAPNFIPGKFWSIVAGVPRGPKDPDSTIDITFDWAAWLADMGGSSIAKVKFTLQGVQDAGSYATGSKTTVFVSGGTVGTASVSCRITTDSIPPRIDERTVYLDLGEQ